MIGTSGFAQIGEFCLGTDGNGANNLIVKSGGSRIPELQMISNLMRMVILSLLIIFI